MSPTWVPWDDPAVLHQGYQTRVGHTRIRVYIDHAHEDRDAVKFFYGFIADGPVVFEGAIRADWDEAKTVALTAWEKAREQGGRP